MNPRQKVTYTPYKPVAASSAQSALGLREKASAFSNYLSEMANTYATTSGEANRISAQSAKDAMAFEAGQAELNRQWQERIWAESNAFNAAEAQKNRDWQEQMSNTAYQRAMADMRAAGLNPILAYTQGGAGIGSGAQATSGTLSGAMATGKNYQGIQESATSIKIISSVLNTASKYLEMANEAHLFEDLENALKKLFKR